MNDTVQHSFLQFAIELKAKPMIEQALQRLQDQLSLNQNVVLYVLWYGSDQHGRLKKPQFTQLHEVTCHWHERITSSLTKLREALATAQGAQANQLKQQLLQEIAIAEEYERCYLIDAIKLIPLLRRNINQQLNDACHNLVNYFKFHSVKLNIADRQASVVILQAIFSDLEGKEVADTFEHAMLSAKIGSGSCVQMSLGDL